MPTFFQMILSTLFISLCPHSFSDGSLSTKQIVFLQRPVLGRKRRESKVRDLTFLLCISWQIGVFSHQSFCQLLNVYPRPTSPSATSNPAAVFVLGKPNTHAHTQRRTNVNGLLSVGDIRSSSTDECCLGKLGW